MRNLFPMRRNRCFTLFGELERVFDDSFRIPLTLNLFSEEVIPMIDLCEKGNKIMVKAELPGVKPEEVELSVDGDLLTIRGEKKQEREAKEKDRYHLERSHGFFQRTVELPAYVKADEAKATYKDGVLQVELPKAEETKKKNIKIDVK